MSQSYKRSLLAEEIDLLVRHFGIKRVRGAIAKVSPERDEEARVPTRKEAPRVRRPVGTNGTSAIESIRETQPEKHRLLSGFIVHLKGRQVLPESQDIRHFAQIIGLKEISGKSREDMISKLIPFLMEQPLEKLRSDVESANNISEQQRQMGFSLLTDKLLGKQ